MEELSITTNSELVQYAMKHGIISSKDAPRATSSTMPCRTRQYVVLADDHRDGREGPPHNGEEFEIVGTVADANQAVNAVLTLDPDVLVIDIPMPTMDGISAAKGGELPSQCCAFDNPQ